MPGNDANSPSITNQLRNEELERRKAVINNYDMFADDYSDTNVKKILNKSIIYSITFSFCRVPVYGAQKEILKKMKINI